MKKKKLKVFTLPIEEFEKKYPVSYSIVVPDIPEGHVAKVVSVRPCQTFIILKDKTIEQYDEIPCCRCLPSSISNRDSSFYSSSLFSSSPIRYLMSQLIMKSSSSSVKAQCLERSKDYMYILSISLERQIVCVKTYNMLEQWMMALKSSSVPFLSLSHFSAIWYPPI